MNGINVSNEIREDLSEVLFRASTTILETMFFAEAEPLSEELNHVEPQACMLQCTGAEEGTFSIAVDRTALQCLCEAFYGDSDINAVQSIELLCELTNMIAGSTLSVYSPDRLCALSSPQLSSVPQHMERACGPNAFFAAFAIEGGTISIACKLRTT